jgi:hypothetical protein
MVLFFIADLALSLALKATTWCLGKTYDGVVYLISRTKTPPPHATYDINDDDDCVIVRSNAPT